MSDAKIGRHTSGSADEVVVERLEERPSRVDRAGVGLRIEFDLELVEAGTDESDEHTVPVAELVVERGDRDAGALGELAHREPIDAALGDERAGRVEHLTSRALLSSLPAVTHGGASIGCGVGAGFT